MMDDARVVWIPPWSEASYVDKLERLLRSCLEEMTPCIPGENCALARRIEETLATPSNVECQHDYRPAAFSESGAHVLGRRCARCEQVEPALPTHERKVAMTTTVKILIEGNKACEVSVKDEGGVSRDPVTVKPGSFTTKTIHGDQRVSVVEVGEFL